MARLIEPVHTLNRVVRVCGGEESDIINYEESII